MAETAVDLRHGPECPCPRCQGFQPGNTASIGNHGPEVHGAYVSPLKLAGRIEEISVALRAAMPHASPTFEPAVQAAAIAGARLERAIVALEAAKPGQFGRLEEDSRGWHRAWMGALDRLGMTPMSASKLGLNLTLAGSVRDSLARRYNPPAPSPDAPTGQDGGS